MSTISVDYDVLNQRGSPAWFTDTFANIPTAGYVGRMFISKDTFAFYRDTGTGWDLIGGPGIGTLTGNGVAGQVSFFSGTQVLAGNNNLFWDNVNSRLGINTTTPGQPLDIHSTGNTLVQLNNTSTGNSNISFQNQDVAKWRVGNLYNAGANSFDILNATTSTTALSISNTTNAATFNNSVTASSLIKSGGTSSQFLKADGSIDSNSYITLTSLSFVAGSGAYSNTTGVITIPTNNNQITNGAGYITSSALSSYLPLTGGTLTGGLYINPTNTGIVGLDVASNTTIIRSDNLEGFKRQLEIVMGSGTLVQLTAKGYGANYGTDLAFYTATTGGTNASPGIYITGTNNRVGIKTGTPAYDLDVTGTGRYTGTLIAGASNGNIRLTGSIDGFLGVGVSDNRLYLTDWTTTTKGLIIDLSTGNVLIGTSTDNGNKLQISGAATISGNLTIGSPTTDPTLTLNGDNVGGDSYINFKADSGGTKVQLLGTKNGGTGGRLTFKTLQGGVLTNAMKIEDSIVTIFAIGSGTVTATSGVLSAVSDMNLKIEDGYIDNALEKVMNLKARYYYWKKESNLPTNIRQLGFYAQEVNEALGEEVANIPKNENDNWGIYDRGMIAMLTKAIQELNEKLVRNNIN